MAALQENTTKLNEENNFLRDEVEKVRKDLYQSRKKVAELGKRPARNGPDSIKMDKSKVQELEVKNASLTKVLKLMYM